MSSVKVTADSGGGTVSLKAPSSTTSDADVELTLPVDDGSADQYLKTDGSGALSWATVSSVGGATGVDFDDGVRARFGASQDVQIYHDSGSNYVKLGVIGSTLKIEGTAETLAVFKDDGTCELNYNNSKKFETTSAGATVTGTLTATLADNSINSDQYVDGSIDHVHLGPDCVEGDNIADGAVGQEHIEENSIGSTQMKDDAIGVAELSATGTASASTVLHGDNRWGLPGPVIGWGSALTTTSVTGSNATWVDTGLTINYTPKSDSSTIHVTGFIHMYGSAKEDTSGDHEGTFQLRLQVQPSGGSESTVGERVKGTFGRGIDGTYNHKTTKKEWQFAFHEKYGNSSTTVKTFHIEFREQENSVMEICKNTGHSFINVMEVV